MSDGLIIVLFFMGIVFIPLIIVLIIIKINKIIRIKKLNSYQGHTLGTITDIKLKGIDNPFVLYVTYIVENEEYSIKETAKLKSEAIKIGVIPVGQRKSFVIGNKRVNDQVEILYDLDNPQKAIIKDNNGVINA